MAGPGVNLHVYRAPILNESRLGRFARTLQATGAFTETHIVGQRGPGLAPLEELEDAVKIVRLGTVRGSGAKASTAAKALSTAAWSWDLLRTYGRGSVAVVASHWVWGLPVCWLLARVTGARLVYNAHELETETPSMQGLKKALAVALERAFVRQCDAMTVVNPSIAAWYGRKGLRKDAVSIRNIPTFLHGDVEPDLRRALEVPAESLLFIHTGRLVGGRFIPEILDAFEKSCSGHHVAFLGDGPLSKEVLAAGARCSRIHHLPFVPPERVVPYVRAADIALCLIDVSSLSYAYSSPNKLFEALAARRPVLCTDLVEARSLLGDLFEWCLVPDPATGLQTTIDQLADVEVRGLADSDELPSLPSWDEEAQRLVEAYAPVLGARR